MKNALTLFWRDIKSVCTNAIGLIVAIGLIIVPALYAWFNIAGSWNLYDNAKNLEVAVANDDAGYQSSLIPMKVDVGETLVDALHDDHSFDWQFVSQKKAMEGVESGEYYATIIIPKDFSRDMMTLFSPKMTHAQLEYYTNEKINPIAPKLLGQGADAVRNKMNSVFTKSIASIGLNIANTLGTYLGSDNSKTAIANMNANLKELSAQLRATGTLVGSYGDVLTSAQELSTAAVSILPADGTAAQQAKSAASQAAQTANSAGQTINSTTTAIDSALASASQAFDSVAAQAQNTQNALSKDSSDAASQIDSVAGDVSTLTQKYEAVRSAVQKVDDSITGTTHIEQRAKQTLNAQIASLTNAINSLNDLHAKLTSAANSIRTNATENATQKASIDQQITAVKKNLAALDSTLGSTLDSQLRQLGSTVSTVGSQAVTLGSDLDSAIHEVSAAGTSTAAQLKTAAGDLTHIQSTLNNAANSLDALTAKIGAALASNDMQTLQDLMKASPSTLAGLIASPVGYTKHVIFPVSPFGAAIMPFYAALAMWVGCLLATVAIKPTYSKRKRSGLPNLKPRQMYLGRQLSITLIAILQSELICLGCLLYLKVPMVHPWLYLFAGFVSAVVYSTLAYTFLLAFGKAGELITEVLLIVQITAADGTYPVVLMKPLYGAISPYLPVTDTIRAFRACLGGIYDNSYWKNIGMLLLFMVPAILLALIFRKPFRRIVKRFTRLSEKSGIVI